MVLRVPVIKTSKIYVTTDKIFFFYYQGYCWHLDLIGFKISFYQFHLVCSAEISKSQIVSFHIFSLLNKRFSYKKRVGVTTVWWHMFLLIFRIKKSWKKKLSKKNVSIWDGINEHVHNQAGSENTHPFYTVFQISKVLIKIYKTQRPGLFFLLFYISFYISWYHFSPLFRDFYHKFSFFNAFPQPCQTLNSQNLLSMT